MKLLVLFILMYFIESYCALLSMMLPCCVISSKIPISNVLNILCDNNQLISS